ncbi:MAG: penicillin-insensitive murein endopeptidase [Solirubrobacteraceae bacterium]
MTRSGSRRPLPAYRVRRRTAGFTAVGTATAFMALGATGSGAQRPAGPHPGTREALLTPATRAASASLLYPRVNWRHSRAIGQPTAGAIVRATKLPAEGRHFVTWDYDRHRTPSPLERRYGTGHLVRLVLTVAAEYGRAHPTVPRLVIGDLSRPHGGGFRSAHASHQNGLDVDIYYPRRDRRERAPMTVGDIDRGLAQDLVDRFVRAGAQYVFIGPNTGLRGPRGVVMVWPRHDNHIHIRLPR